MTIRIAWLGLSLMLATGITSSRVAAQSTAPTAPQIYVVPTVPYEPAYQPASLSPLTGSARPAPADRHFRRMLNNNGMGCTTNSYYPTCTNWRYEALFAFGSCRDFFGESCTPNRFLPLDPRKN